MAEVDEARRIARYEVMRGMERATRYTSATLYFAMSSAMQGVQDLAMKALQAGNIDALKNNIELMLGHDFDVATRLKTIEGVETAAEVRKSLVNTYKGLYDNWKAGIWHGVGNVYSAAMEQFLGAGDLLWAYKHLMHRIAITPKLERYWMSLYRPTLPNTDMAFDLWKRGLIDEAKFKTYASYDGWSDDLIGKLMTSMLATPNERTAFRLYTRGAIDEAAYKKYIKADLWPDEFADKFKAIYEWWPSAQEAFYMWMKGIISEAERNKFYRGHGYPARLHSQITDNYYIYPNAHEAFWMWKKGIILKDVRNAYYKAQGYPAALSEKLTENMEQLPTAAEAFYLWKKGLITVGQRNLYYRANGYPDMLWAKLTTNMEYTPTLYDLIRLADDYEIDTIWATKKLTERGVKDTDIPKIIDYLKYRPLREEVRGLVNKLVWRYEYGRISLTELEAELDKLPIGPTEKDLTIDLAEMKYEDELVNEQMEIYKWRFRMGWITEEDYLNGLLDLGIREEKANLIVETEKAQGYFGYY